MGIADARREPTSSYLKAPPSAPLRPDREGALLFEVMMGDPRGWGDDPESFQRLLELRGADALPDPGSNYHPGSRISRALGDRVNRSGDARHGRSGN